jgi:hypothetical protein
MLDAQPIPNHHAEHYAMYVSILCMLSKSRMTLDDKDLALSMRKWKHCVKQSRYYGRRRIENRKVSANVVSSRPSSMELVLSNYTPQACWTKKGSLSRESTNNEPNSKTRGRGQCGGSSHSSWCCIYEWLGIPGNKPQKLFQRTTTISIEQWESLERRNMVFGLSGYSLSSSSRFIHSTSLVLYSKFKLEKGTTCLSMTMMRDDETFQSSYVNSSQ